MVYSEECGHYIEGSASGHTAAAQLSETAQKGAVREYEVLTMSDGELTTRTKKLLHNGAEAELTGFEVVYASYEEV